MKKLLLTISFAAALAGLNAPALAAPVDLTSWLVLGDSLVSTGSAKVTTAYTDETPLGSGALDITALELQLNTASGTGSFWGARRYHFKTATPVSIPFAGVSHFGIC